MGREGVHGVVRGNRAAGSRGALETQCREAGVMNALWRPRACAVGARHSAPADFGQWRAHGHTAQRALANAMSPIGTNPSAGRGGLSSWLASIESGVDAALRPVLGEVPARAKSAAWPCPAWSRPAPGTLRSVLALVAWVWVQQAYNMPTGPLALTGSTRLSLRMAADLQYGDGFGTAGSGPVAGAAAGSDPHQRAAAGRAARPRGRKRQRRCATQMAGAAQCLVLRDTCPRPPSRRLPVCPRPRLATSTRASAPGRATRSSLWRPTAGALVVYQPPQCSQNSAGYCRTMLACFAVSRAASTCARAQALSSCAAARCADRAWAAIGVPSCPSADAAARTLLIRARPSRGGRAIASSNITMWRTSGASPSGANVSAASSRSGSVCPRDRVGLVAQGAVLGVARLGGGLVAGLLWIAGGLPGGVGLLPPGLLFGSHVGRRLLLQRVDLRGQRVVLGLQRRALCLAVLLEVLALGRDRELALLGKVAQHVVDGGRILEVEGFGINLGHARRLGRQGGRAATSAATARAWNTASAGLAAREVQSAKAVAETVHAAAATSRHSAEALPVPMNGLGMAKPLGFKW